MTGGRTAILATLRARRRPDAANLDPAAWMAAHARPVLPTRTRGATSSLVERFIAMAREADTTVDQVDAVAAIPGAIAAYLKDRNLPTRLRVADHADLAAVPWESAPLLEVVRGGKAEAADPVSVTRPACGVAETGTLMLLSGADSPTTLSFLPDTNIAVLHAADIVGGYEDAWDLMRARSGGLPPRSVNFVTGPSRSADIEQTLLMGAHGPRRLHLVLVGAPRAGD